MPVSIVHYSLVRVSIYMCICKESEINAVGKISRERRFFLNILEFFSFTNV